MKYAEQLIARIKDTEKWPAPERANFLNELNAVADEVFAKDTIEGYLAAILIYHQITEELLKVLLECCEFFIQLGIFPAEIQFQHSDKRMFGQLLNDIEKTITFDDKEKLVASCKELNEVRIRLVHKLTTRSSLAEIKTQSSKIKDTFDEIFTLYDEIYDGFRVGFNNHKKNGDWDEWLEEMQKE